MKVTIKEVSLDYLRASRRFSKLGENSIYKDYYHSNLQRIKLFKMGDRMDAELISQNDVPYRLKDIDTPEKLTALIYGLTGKPV